MGVPVVYRKTQDSAIASYDYFDIATGSGYRRLYGISAGVGSGAALTYALSTQTLDSTKPRTDQYNSGSSVYTKDIDLDFDLSFAAPQSVKGPVLAQITYGLQNINPGVQGDFFLAAAVKKVDLNSVETTLKYLSGGMYHINVPQNAIQEYREIASLDVSKTHFSAGEKLRFTTEVWTKAPASQDFKINLYFDGANRVKSLSGNGWFASHDTNLLVDVPFVIDI